MATRAKRRWPGLSDALARTRLHGIATNLDYLRQMADGGEVHPLPEKYRPAAIEAGTYTSVQDYPGRAGYWDIGVPPSGPMDDYAFRLANRIVGNAPDAAGIEATLAGPTLRFHGDAVIALTGRNARPRWTARPCRCGGRWRCARARCWPRAARCRAAACTWPCATAWTCPSTWAAARPSRWDSLAAMPAHAARGRHAAARASRAAGRARRGGRTAGRAARAGAGLWRYLAHRRALRAAWRAGLLAGGHRRFFAADWEVHYNPIAWACA